MVIAMESAYLLVPARTHTQQGQERRVGVEIELSGMTYQELVEVLCTFFGTNSHEKARYERVIETDLGAFTVELDSDPIKKLDLHHTDLPEPLKALGDSAGELIDATAERIVPLEVICPPIPLSQLNRVEQLCQKLRKSGAQGSRHAIWYAFGLQFNPELPNLEAATILNYLRAFSGLYDWFKSRRQLDISRKFTTYIDPYPSDYVNLIMSPDYQPDLDQLIEDYLAHNPTRNRAMDLMPLFAHLKGDWLHERIEDPRIKARPTLHVRLPDCDIDNPQWHFADVWNDWVQIDDLANDPAQLKALCKAYQERHCFTLSNLFADWEEESEQFLPHPDQVAPVE